MLSHPAVAAQGRHHDSRLMIFMNRVWSPCAMTLRLRINIIVGTLTLLFVAGLLAQQLGEMRQAVQEEVVAANRVAAQLLNRLMWGYAARGPTALTAALRDLGRVRSNEITLIDRQGQV